MPFLESLGSKIHWDALNDERFAEELKVKLLEEANEVCAATSKEELLEELADVVEVIHAFCDLNGVALEDVLAIRERKFQERGGFQGRKYVTVAEHLPGSFGEQYCLANPTKYPEIV